MLDSCSIASLVASAVALECQLCLRKKCQSDDVVSSGIFKHLPYAPRPMFIVTKSSLVIMDDVKLGRSQRRASFL